MKIFIGYHFGPNEAWVEGYLYALVESFGDKVVHGKNLYGEADLCEAIIERIEDCHALIGVASRNLREPDGQFSTHPWAQHELVVAKKCKKHWLQMREVGVNPRQGMLQDEFTRTVDYDVKDLAPALVTVATTLGNWHAKNNVRPYLLPDHVVASIAPHVNKCGLVCKYQLLDSEFNKVGSESFAPIHTVPGGVRIVLSNVPTDSLVQVTVTYGDQSWHSETAAIDSPFIVLK